MMGEYVVVSGLTLDDYVAFPDETLKAGMKAEMTDGYVPMDGEDGFDGALIGEDGAFEEGEYPFAEGEGLMDNGFAAENGGAFAGEDAAIPEIVPEEGATAAHAD